MAALTGSPESCSKRFFCLCRLRDEYNPHRSVGQASCPGAFLPRAHGAAVPAVPELLQGLSLSRAHPFVWIFPGGALHKKSPSESSKVGSFLRQIQPNNISNYPSVMNEMQETQ